MNFNTKLIVPTLALFFSTVVSCTSGNIPSVKGNITTSSADMSQIEFDKAIQSLNLAPGEKPTIINVGNNKAGGSFAFKINLNEGFKVKNNSSSLFDGNPASINSFKLALINSGASLGAAGNPISAINVKSGPFSIIKVGSATTALMLTNVDAGSYYVAVAAYKDTGATINVTKFGTNVYTIAGENFALSTTGGDSSTGGLLSTGGIITINPSFQINTNATSNPMGVPLQLINPGANIDTSVSIGVYDETVTGPP